MKLGKANFTDKNVANFFIAYELDTWAKDINTKFILGDGLFRTVKLTKNADPDKYGYSGNVLDLMHVHTFCYQMASEVKIMLFMV